MNSDPLNEQLAEEMVKRTDKLQDTTIDIAVRLKQARDFMAWSAVHVRASWLAWVDESNEANKHMNLFRMAFDRESKAIIATGKDIVDFFNSPAYVQAHNTLKETVAMLDRFAELKRNGTLDAFADFILKIECKS